MDNKYCVYLHRDLEGSVFYVGKGTLKRAKSRQVRSIPWKERSKNGWTYQILKDGLSSQEALQLEEKLITIYKETCVNITKTGVVKEVKKEMFSDVLAYSEDSPSGLVWKVDRLCGRGAIRVSTGAPAGTLDRSNTKRGWRVNINGSLYYAHRIIWAIVNGNLDPTLVIDHLDGNPHNNKITNLLPKTQADNNRNTLRETKPGRNKGISRRTFNGKPNVYYVAHWHDVHGKVKSKCFSATKFGEDVALSMAKNYRVKMITELISSGCNYTDRHIDS